ncbi:MAG: phosphatase PAP2 family protein, partial [Gemmatimonadota bacterium]|nr:phosphatase PAP2 family protein [Gemmatimonadota bacterium]
MAARGGLSSAEHMLARAPRIRRRPEGLAPHTALLIGLSTVALAACAKLGEDVFSKETAPFDEPIRDWFLAHHSSIGDRVFLTATRAGGPSVVIPLSVLAGAWLRGRRNLPIAGTVLLAPATALALFLLIKRIYRRQRPAGAALHGEKTYSFPSGHAASSAAVFGTLAYVLWREEMLDDEVAVVLALLPPLLIGTSRVYLDVNYATDVLGGWSVGSV